MLQQTQVSVVIPYYDRWMREFPTIESLSNATIEQVIKNWEGLGYYSRARNIHHTAKTIVREYDGIFPRHKDQLKNLKGLGPYTVGAIRSFAFHEKEPAVDGNILRVLSRLFLIETPIDTSQTKKIITETLSTLLPEKKSWVVNEALIELGALVCKKQPICCECPLRSQCRSYQANKTLVIPIKKNKLTTKKLHRNVAVITSKGHILVKKTESGIVMSDLYEFPYFEHKDKVKKNFQQHLESTFDLSLEYQRPLSKETHSFTKYRVTLYPEIFSATQKKSIKGYQWIRNNLISQLPFSAGHRRILHQLDSLNFLLAS